MKLTTLSSVGLAILCLFIFSCQKTFNQSDKAQQDNPADLLKDAQRYFEKEISPLSLDKNVVDPNNPFAKLEKKPLWNNAYIQNLSIGDVVVIPVNFTSPLFLNLRDNDKSKVNINDYSKLLIYKDNTGKFQYKYIIAIPDSNFKKHKENSFTGVVHLIDWAMNYKEGLWFDLNGVMGLETHLLLDSFNQGPVPTLTAPVNTCITTDWYSCTDVCTYLYSTTSCVTIDVTNGGGSGGIPTRDYGIVAGGGSGGGNVYSNGIVDGPNLIFQFTDSTQKTTLYTLFTCFNTIPNSGATYSISLCADIPVNSNPEALLNSSFHPGHAFITLTKTNGNSTVSLSFGFYPSIKALSITNTPVSSEVKDDGQATHEYNAKITLHNVSAASFQDIQSRAINAANTHSYILGSYNCTNYALDLFNAETSNPISVPDWIGPFSGVNYGKTPNGLYKTLVNMQGRSNTDIYVGVARAPSDQQCN